MRLSLVNRQFGRILIIKFVYSRNRKSYWLCECSCGNNKIIAGVYLTSGKIKSCGCLRKEIMSTIGKENKTHGNSFDRFYKIWQGMKSRCLTTTDDKYSKYGGRGIKICKRWLDFNNFKEDMHESYLKHVEEFGEKNTTLDRIDVNGNYEPNNIRWATLKQQSRNTRTSAISDNYDDHMYWKHRLYTNLNIAISSNCKTSKLLEPYLGCSLPEFRNHIESIFLLGMSWNNHGKQIGMWQFDHIIGCNNFDLSKEEDRKKCFNYTNIRPVWWVKHKTKSTRRKEVARV